MRTLPKPACYSPRTNQYGNDSHYGTHTLVVEVNDHLVYYSYDQPVGIRYPDGRVVIGDLKWSVTTAKHINLIHRRYGSAATVIPYWAFEKVIIPNYEAGRDKWRGAVDKDLNPVARLRKKDEPVLCPELESIEAYKKARVKLNRHRGAVKAAATRKARKEAGVYKAREEARAAEKAEEARRQAVRVNIQEEYPNVLAEEEGAIYA